MTAPIRLLLVDDHALFTEGLRELLSFHDDLDVIGTTNSGERALVEIARLVPTSCSWICRCPGSTESKRPVESPPTTRTSQYWL